MNKTIVDKMVFFREFSIRICGSRQISKALNRSYQYLKQFMPIDELLLTAYDADSGKLQVLAHSSDDSSCVFPPSIILPERVRKTIRPDHQAPILRILNDSLPDLILGHLAAVLDWPPSSVLIKRLVLDGRILGALWARANGRNRYTREHGKLWDLTHEPAVMVLLSGLNANRLKHQDDFPCYTDHCRYSSTEIQNFMTEKITGVFFGLKEVMEKVKQVAPFPSPVLLLGETGTGKELIANAIHALSPRQYGPFIKVNCGSIPDTLIDSELFGHEKGAFTGALSLHKGRFERAHGGSIFLDEIGELSLQAQVRLLRVLQEKVIERVGGSSQVEVDTRIISATHQNLNQLVVEQQFRDDLFFRLNVFPIVIPPLRERMADIPELVRYFVKKKKMTLGLSAPITIKDGEMDRLQDYHWPGNVRELENVVERAIILSEGKPLMFKHIVSDVVDDMGCPSQANGFKSIAEVEINHIKLALKKADGRVEGKGGAAELLDINPATLRNKMRRLGIPFGLKTGKKNDNHF